MSLREEGPTYTKEELAQLRACERAKTVRMHGILTALWDAHPDMRPKSDGEHITQANALYHELYGDKEKG